MVLHDETSHMSEANFFFFYSSNALTNCSCSFHTKSCICTLRSFIIFFVLASFAELLCDLFSVSEKPNYGHWVMSEQSILWDQHCLCQSYRKHKWPTDRGTKRFLVRFFFFFYIYFEALSFQIKIRNKQRARIHLLFSPFLHQIVTFYTRRHFEVNISYPYVGWNTSRLCLKDSVEQDVESSRRNSSALFVSLWCRGSKSLIFNVLSF